MRSRSKQAGALAFEIVLSTLVIAIMGVGLRNAYQHFFQTAYPVAYGSYVERYSKQSGLPPSLVYAVIRTESGFSSGAESGVAARGLMQITRETFEWAQMRSAEEESLHFDDLFDPETNIRYGAVILQLHIEQFGSVENALCAYHAGAGDLQRWLKNPEYSLDGKNLDRIPSAATRHYVDKVLEAQRRYENLYGLAD